MLRSVKLKVQHYQPFKKVRKGSHEPFLRKLIEHKLQQREMTTNDWFYLTEENMGMKQYE